MGSELGSMDEDPGPWKGLIKKVRARFRGKLIYSANWDHYDQVRIWHLVDLAGLSAYFQLTAPGERPTLQRLTHSWREQRVQIERWLVRTGKPLVFTEVGYHSQKGTSCVSVGRIGGQADQPAGAGRLLPRVLARLARGAALRRGLLLELVRLRRAAKPRVLPPRQARGGGALPLAEGRACRQLPHGVGHALVPQMTV